MNLTLSSYQFFAKLEIMCRIQIIFWLFLFILGLDHSTLNAQSRSRSTDQDYYRLAWRAKQPQTFIQHTVLPTTDTLQKVLFGYSFSYDFLQFKKRLDLYESTLAVNVDVYRTSEKEAKEIEELERKEREENRKAVQRGRRPNLNAIREERLNRIEEMIPVQTLVFRDTIRVETYEATSSATGRVEGNFLSHLPQGIYRYRLEVRQNGNQKPLQSRFRTLRIRKDSLQNANPPSLLVGNVDTVNSTFRSLNMDGRIPFGVDFDVLAWVPDSLSLDSLNLYLNEINQMVEPEKDSLEKAFIEGQLLPITSELKLMQYVTDAKSINPLLDDSKLRLIAFRVNGKDLKNSRYRFAIKTTMESKPVAIATFNSFWSDMPLSLYDINIALDMMRFILKEDQLKQLKVGSAEDKIKHFESFWEKRDPTPKTDFNELMAEYFRRIDYAFENYSTPSTPGFESDLGNAYILIGPPISTERVLLGNNQTRITWDYPKVQLIFQSTSGFGDYRLIERKSKS